jgi:hypothetical protein
MPRIRKHDPADRATCSFCGIAEDIHLLDGVLKDKQDTGKISCIACYPNDSWCPTGIEHIAISIAPSLKLKYDAWLERERERLMFITQETVDTNLNAAMDGGYDISDWTAEDIAIDLLCYAADCESSTVEVLIPFIQAWKDARCASTPSAN